MLFSEIYGSYFQVVTEVLREAVSGTLTEQRLYQIVGEKGFEESSINLPSDLKSGKWPLITGDYKTPIKHEPKMPLTLVRKTVDEIFAVRPENETFWSQ